MKASYFPVFFFALVLILSLVVPGCGDDDDNDDAADDDDDTTADDDDDDTTPDDDDDDDDNDDDDDDDDDSTPPDDDDDDDDDTTPCDGCLIDDVCYTDNETNPANVCEICVVSQSTDSWSNNDFATCVDGLFCNGTDTCAGGACSQHAGDPCDAQCESCNDGIDVCDPQAGSCDDGVFCNGADTCNGGTCSDHAGDPCDAQCESCNEGTDVCDPQAGSCDDDVFCNGDDTCNAGACTDHAGDPCDAQCESCNDGTDVCDPQAGSCDDGDFCNGADTCNAGACTDHAGDPCDAQCESCNDGTDVCDPQAGSCDDGEFCNGDDTCNGGSCSDHAGDPCEIDETCNEVFAECYDPEIETFIPEGAFWMGCEPNDTQCWGDGREEPRHQVTLSAYYIDTYEVTNEQYAAFLTANGNLCGGQHQCVEAGAADIRVHGSAGVWTPDSGFEDHPMIVVSWYGAKVFCEYYGGRLPTEAEWEKAAKGAAEHYIYPWGDTWIANAANWSDNNDPWETGDYPWTNPVGYYSGSNHEGAYQTTDGRSPYGVHDMAGNVFEWVSDWYLETYYSTSPSTDPPGPATGTFRVSRGGSWQWMVANARTSYRHWGNPGLVSFNFGFRCSRD